MADRAVSQRPPANFADMTQQALRVKAQYADLNARKGQHCWTSAEYVQGLVGDVGDLAKLVMALNGFRAIDEADKLVAHELADCLWAIIVIAHELDIDLAHAFDTTMDQLEAHLARSLATG